MSDEAAAVIGIVLIGLVCFALPIGLILWSWWWVFEDDDDE